MNEGEWTTCDNPKAMLAFLAAQKASERKLRLFCCACFRRVWHALTDPQARAPVEVAERYADGAAGDEERAEALEAAARGRQWGGGAARWAVVAMARMGAVMAVDVAGQGAACPPGQGYDPARWQAEWQGQCDLLRDLFGPRPFREVRIDARWLQWDDGMVRKLAQSAYQDRLLPGGALAPDRLAVLADALEEAGCGDEELLGHLRGPGPHVRGCWVVDFCLGRA
jgi:hypothetical protein